jgi:3-hydroxyacyl-CoA dehydrogenase
MVAIDKVTDLVIDREIAVLTIDSPPVNALSVAVRRGLLDGLGRALDDPAVSAIVLICAGRTFIAGADIKEFEGGIQEPSLSGLQAAMEAASKPIVAAIHGTALGGGLEVALTCHYRVAVRSAKVGLPEVTLGLLPGAGGTQRLPRMVGAEASLEIMTSGKPMTAEQALEIGLIDAIADENDLRESATAFARQIVVEGRPLRRIRDLEEKLLPARENPALFEEFRKKNARAFRGFKAPWNIIKAVEAAVTLPFDEGIKREGELFAELIASTESAAQRYMFFAERQAAKIPGITADTPLLPIKTVGVIGAGTMGGGIAMNFLNIGLPVTLIEQTQEALDRGVATIRKNYEVTVSKGRLSAESLETRMGLLHPTLGFEALGGCDLVIEAVFENLALKQQIFTRLDTVARPGAILASNTSFLDLDAIAAATMRPDHVVGLHFFSPANVMRLLEVVRGAKTSPAVVASAMQLGRGIGKIAVLSGVCDGFIANRMMTPRSKVADALILNGPMPWEVDRVMQEYGFSMGPFAMMDLVGLDVIGWDPETSSGSTVQEVLCEAGRRGQKCNGGYYDYDERRRATPSPIAEQAILELSARQDLERRAFSDEEIVECLLYPVINEGAKLLEEGIALRASDIDVALVAGYGWPIYTGGPMFWADTIGLSRVVEKLDSLSTHFGDGLRPAPLLRRLAEQGKQLHDI